MNENVIAKAEKIIADKVGRMSEGFCALALIDDKGYPTASTVSISKADGIKWLTFCVSANENKARRVAGCNRASVCINSPNYNITLVGTAEIITDPKVKKEMWYAGCEHHWASPDDPEYAVLRFATERYNLRIGMEGGEGNL